VGNRDDSYNDEYPTCARTHASVRVFSDAHTPNAIGLVLGTDGTSSHLRGEGFGNRGLTRKTNAWFLSSEDQVTSKDLRRHIDWLLDRLPVAPDAVQTLAREGARIDVFCYWLSKSGHGGPALSAPQMERLARLGLTISLDVYLLE
jgi:hypothetical protein